MRRAIVTGGMSGLGAACAERLAAEGVEVVRLDVAAGADAVVDITDEQAVQVALGRVGPVDILVNSAGIVGPNAPLWEVSTADWERTFAVNVTGAFRLCHALVPGMVDRGWGRIVNIASIAGKDGNPETQRLLGVESRSDRDDQSLGKELATTGVLVNAVAPAVFETPMNATTAPDVLERLVSLIPMQRLGRAEESQPSWHG